jgi:hypothetical protein
MRHPILRAGRFGGRLLSWWTSRKSLRRPPRELGLEPLEARDVPALMRPSYILFHPVGMVPLSSSGPSGTTPAQARHAYGFDQITFSNGTVAGDGSGTTIAIVDAYDDPTIASDLHQFDVTFGLPDPVFTKMNQNGGSTMPSGNTGWAGEISLDVEWAHAIAPGAKILLVEANSASGGDLYTADRTAASQPGVVAVSNSWAGGEYGGETGDDATFTTPAGHNGVTFFFSSGDSGSPAVYPSASPNVVSVGGTTLSIDASGNYLGESAWSGSGGGLSSVEGQPSYQKGIVTQSSTRRATPDVAYDSNPSTGFPTYDSYSYGTAAPWVQFGGTSDAAPQWAALLAIADQGRLLAGAGTLDGPSQTLPTLYRLPQSDFHDITTGSSTGSPNEPAGPGYDLATGRGTPIAPLVVTGLIGGPQATVLDGTQPVADGTSDSYSALVGAAGTHTFTVQNTGGATLTLSPTINLPSGFTLVSGFGATTLTPGATTTFTVAVSTAAAATYSGTVSFGTSDLNNNPYSFKLTATVATTEIIDDGSAAGFNTTGSWTYFTGQGYQNNVHYSPAGSGSSTAGWTFAVAPGTYQVAVTYFPYSNRATNAPYTVLDGSTPLGTVPVNQQLAPSDFSDQGVGWKNVGTFTVASTTLVVRLSNNANNYVIADAVRVQVVPNQPIAAVFDGSTAVANGGSDSFGATLTGTPVTRTFTVKNTGIATLTLSDPINVPSGFQVVQDFGSTSVPPGSSTTFQVRLTAAQNGSYSGTLAFGTNDTSRNPYAFTVSGTVAASAIIDDSSASGFATSGAWSAASGQGYLNTVHYAAAGSGGSTATWTFTVAPGAYQVAVTYSPYSNRATNAPYTVFDNSASQGTVPVNQQQTPSAFTDQGVGWTILGNFTIASTTLAVQLTNNANGYVIADAVRIQKAATGPLAAVFDGSTSVPDGGSDSYGSVFSGTVKRFTVTNLGAATLTLSDPINVPSGFSVSSDFGSTSLAPGASTTFAVQVVATTPATYSGTLSFGTDDPGNNPYAFAISATVVTTAILDDSSPSGFATLGSWSTATGQGYQNNLHFAAPGSGSSTATWTFAVAPGLYQVAVTYSPYSNRATNSPYTVFDNSAPQGTVPVNQQLTPSDFSDQGVGWTILGNFAISSSTLAVQLTDSANGYVIADAVRIHVLPSQPVAAVYDGGTSVANGGSDPFGSVFTGTVKTFTVKNAGTATLTLADPIQVPSGFSVLSDFGSTSLAPGASTTFAVQVTATTPATYSGTLSFGTNDAANNPYAFTLSATVVSTEIIDDGSSAGFATSGSWSTATGQGYLSNVHYAAAGNGSSTATWTFAVVPGTYQVAVTYSPFSNRATNAPYTVFDSSASLGSVPVNQQMTPSDFTDQGVGWTILNSYVVTTNTLVVQLTNSANGYVIADAVRIQKS